MRPRLFNRLCPWRAWTEIDHCLNVGQRLIAGKIFPDFFGRVSTRVVARAKDDGGEKASDESFILHPASQGRRERAEDRRCHNIQSRSGPVSRRDGPALECRDVPATDSANPRSWRTWPRLPLAAAGDADACRQVAAPPAARLREPSRSGAGSFRPRHVVRPVPSTPKALWRDRLKANLA